MVQYYVKLIHDIDEPKYPSSSVVPKRCLTISGP